MIGGALLVLAAPGCADGASACVVGADCPSGQCNADGSCVPPDDGSTGGAGSSSTTEPGSTGTTVASAEGSGDETTEGADETGPGPANCMPPNADGLIERPELFFDPGLQVNFLAAQAVTFDTAGTVLDGETVWDLSVAFPGDQTSSGEFLSVQGQWFEPAFPAATYATRLTDGDDLLGVFQATDSALVLLGVVSPTGGATRTELVYDPPATVLSFPLVQGKAWSSESTVTGVALGVPSVYTEQYENSVSGQGTLRTPFGDYAVLRVGAVLTRTLGIVPTVIRSYSFISECVGTVGTVRSRDNEDGVEFTQVAELRRIDP